MPNYLDKKTVPTVAVCPELTITITDKVRRRAFCQIACVRRTLLKVAPEAKCVAIAVGNVCRSGTSFFENSSISQVRVVAGLKWAGWRNLRVRVGSAPKRGLALGQGWSAPDRDIENLC